MRRALAVCLVLAIGASSHAADWSPDAAAARALAQGKAWSDVAPSTDGANFIRGAVDVAAPPRAVWSVITDCARAKRLVPSLVSCRTLQGDVALGWSVRESVTHPGFLLPNIRNVARNDYQPYTLIRFHRVGGDLRIQEGEWRLQPLPGGGTRVIYENRVAANMAAPGGLLRGIIKHDTIKVLENLRRESLAAARG